MEDLIVLTLSKAVREAFEQAGATFEDLENNMWISDCPIDGQLIEEICEENDFNIILSSFVVRIKGEKGGDTTRWKQ